MGEEALQSGPEKAENGSRAQESRRLQAQIDTSSRADYLGPPVAQPTPVPDETAPAKPQLRTSPQDLGPIPPAVEPPLPAAMRAGRLRRIGAGLASSCFLFGGCAGYHIGNIQPKYMEGIHSIAVPAFKNDTLIPRIEVLVSDTFIRQIQQDGTYKIASSDATADAMLEGTITEVRRRASRDVHRRCAGHPGIRDDARGPLPHHPPGDRRSRG